MGGEILFSHLIEFVATRF